jgi:hypothetical protein
LRRRMLAPNKPFDLKNHRYIMGIFQDACNEMVLMKAAQMTASEYLISWMLWSADVLEATGLYVFPTDTHVSDFSAARLGPALDPEASPYLASLIVPAQGEQRGADRVGLKRIRNRFIYFRGSKVQPDGRAPQLKSIDADVLALDEFDEMDPRAPALAYERLGHSQISEIRKVSTPTFSGVGIHREYLNSDQRTWHVRCTKCGRFQNVTIDDLVIEWDDMKRPVAWHKTPNGTPFLACRKCGGPLDRCGPGEWVATYPDRDVHGYHLSRLFAAYRKLSEILDSLKEVDETKRQQAYNQALGLPYRSATTMSLDQDTLDNCRREYVLHPGSGSVVCGVDVGSVLHVVIREVLPGGDRPARFIGEVPEFEDLAQLLNMHGVRRCVIDALPEKRKAREFQAAQQDRTDRKVWLAYYQTQKSNKKKAPVRASAADKAVLLDRTWTLDMMLALFATASRGEPGNTLPANARDLPDYYAQMMAPERRFIEGADGNKVPIYIESGPDHFAHAENYCNAAAMLPEPVDTGSGGAGTAQVETHEFGEDEIEEMEEGEWVPRMG